MECLQDPIPLSTFLFGRTAVDLQREVGDLSLRFEQLTAEMDGKLNGHPVVACFQRHALHTHVFSQHQLDVWRFGSVLDINQRLILVAAPPWCDSGAIANASRSSALGIAVGSQDGTTNAYQQEHIFIVYQVGLTGCSKAIFKLIFKDEPKELVNFSQPSHFPRYKLCSVCVSFADNYTCVQNITQLKAKGGPKSYHSIAETDLVMQHRITGELSAGKFDALADAWVAVAQGMTHRGLEHGSYSGASSFSPLALQSRLKCTYASMGKRMSNRIEIVRKSTAVLSDWRSQLFDISYYDDCTGVKSCVAPCYRVVMRDSRSCSNLIDHELKEVLAFIPDGTEAEGLYQTVAADRLRLWVVKALMTAELHSLHVLLFEFDVFTVISQCVGLLLGQHHQYRDVHFHVCKIVVETVEDYVQHSGVVWRVLLSVVDTDSDGTMDLCQGILSTVQTSKTRSDLPPPIIDSLDNQNKGQIAVAPICVAAAESVPTQPTRLMHLATLAKVQLSDDTLFPLFTYCDIDGNGEVSAVELIKMFLCQENKIEQTRETERTKGLYRKKLSTAESLRVQDRSLCENPLSSLGGCGLPFDEESVGLFVASFCLRRSSLQRKTSPNMEQLRLSYTEFCIMMLALARR